MRFDDLGLLPELIRALADQGYTDPTPVQAQAIPPALAGQDLLAAAQTGTGKTAAFALPLLQRLSALPRQPGQTRPRALVLTPTRELALQVNESLRAYGKHLRLKTAVIFGGVGMQPQVDALRRGVDIVVACPGRLIDHMGRRSVDLSGISILVLDEADRMLDMGFLPAMQRVLAALPRQNRQTLLFSATFPEPIKALAREFMRSPAEVQVAARNSVAATVSHRVHPVDAARKRELLLELLSRDSRRQTLVFARTKHGSDKLAKFLEASGLRCAVIHGNKSQNARTRALSDFKAGKATIMIATDIAARGIDIDQLPVVINFELPMVAEDYVHRIGRTGRAGAEGQAISLVCPEESSQLRDIQRVIGRDIEQALVAGFEPHQPLRLDGRAPSQPARRAEWR
ncbi:MAG: DEAD/DEAH box helicase [Xanthomonadales bacterium]|nr:DEAD/DEAH box helicase [Xanthomonadales bacterium]